MEEQKEVYIGAYVPKRLKDWLLRRAAAEHRTLSEELTLLIEKSHQLIPRVEALKEGKAQSLKSSTYSLTVPVEPPTTPQLPPENADAWAILESMEGSFEAPADWASEFDHYLYGTPKRLESSE